MFGLIYEGYVRLFYGKRPRFSQLMLHNIITFDRKKLKKVETKYTLKFPVYSLKYEIFFKEDCGIITIDDYFEYFKKNNKKKFSNNPIKEPIKEQIEEKKDIIIDIEDLNIDIPKNNTTPKSDTFKGSKKFKKFKPYSY